MRTDSRASYRAIIAISAAVECLLVSSCARAEYRELFVSSSPDGRYVARLDVIAGSTLTDTLYRLVVFEAADPAGQIVAFEGAEADVAPPVWADSQTVLLPFCFGSIHSMRSVLPFQPGGVQQFRSRSSPNIRVDVVTAPSTTVAGHRVCFPGE